MKSLSWKTSLCGVLAIVGGIIIQFYPEYSRHGMALAALGAGLAGIFARDNDKTSADVGAITKTTTPDVPAQPKAQQ